MKSYITVLSIAGSDSVGGAGIQADIKTCSALGVYAMTAITAVTAQNTQGVRSYEGVSLNLLRDQLHAVFQDVEPDAVKIGMVPSAEAAHVIAEVLREYKPRNVVVDPVWVATSGDALSDESAMKVIKDELFPLATVITPNIPEAEGLSGMKFADAEQVKAEIDNFVVSMGCHAALIKGGHFRTEQLTDVLSCDGKIYKFTHPIVDTSNTHGTGCSLSSAIACFLAHGRDLPDACRTATNWLSAALQSGSEYSLGKGHGPVNHLFNIIKN